MPNEVKWGISVAIGLGLIYAGWHFGAVLIALHVMLCLMLILVVLLQSGKAADLAGAFGGAGSQTAFGPRGAATFLSKATSWCAIMFMLTSMVLVLRQTRFTPSRSGASGSVLNETAPAKSTTPPAPAQQPPAQTPGQTPAQQAPAQPTPAPATPAPGKTPPPAKQ